MSDVYVVLPSHWTPEFPGNTRASFKVRLANVMRFPPEEKWEVALSGITLAPGRLNMNVLGFGPETDLISTEARIQLGSNKFGWIYANVKMKDVSDLGMSMEGGQGLHFIKQMVDKLDADLHGSSMDTGNRVIALPRFTWKKLGGEWELQLDAGVGHGLSESGVGYGKFQVNKDLALRMGWVLFKKNKAGTLYASPGPNAIPQLREYDTTVNGKKTATYGRSADTYLPSKDYLMTYSFVEQMVLFSNKVKWRFVNLDETFGSSFHPTLRTLYVYSNLGESVTVGNSKTDLLREVPYDPEKRVSFFEPDRERFVKVRHQTLEVCEINVAETDGPLTKFSDSHGHTLVTLHFRPGKNV